MNISYWNPVKRYLVKAVLALGLLNGALPTSQAAAQPKWPVITQQNKPWSRWWWMGSAVNANDLTAAMEKYEKAGLGGLEITPIYGVKGYENQFVNFLSPQWMGLLKHTLSEGQRLGLGIDLAQASGWPFGGPWVTEEDACKYVAHQTYPLKTGESLKEPITFRQKPIVRAVNRRVELSALVEPIHKNANLQALALDQVRFDKLLPLQLLVAYSDKGQTLALTDKVDANGKLTWKAPAGNWTLYAVFQGWHGKMVERAGPGGEGNVIDHFNETATKNYLHYFDQAFAGHDVKGIRAYFNDSYEVDDAQGQADWTAAMLEEFKKRRGYDLRNQLPSLFGKDSEENNSRVRCDYRETISDLLLEKYSQVWHDWAKGRGAINRNQAHGSPANILDLYSVSDIPEIEGTDVLRIKFASSAANVTGKKLTSSESATWLNEHFLSSWGNVKGAMDQYFIGGVNHTFYHGTNYSPQNEAWPGWLFYAAVHFTPANPLWNDFSTLNNYVARCQSFLQQGKPNNDALLYFPIYDRFSDPGKAMLEHFDGLEREFEGTTIKADARAMQERGYTFDFISDRQLANVEAANRQLQTGGVAYQTVILPDCKYIPLTTFEQLVKLAQSGATIVIHKNLPADVPGLGKLDERRSAFRKLLAQLSFVDAEGIKKAKVGQGTFLLGNDLEQLLAAAGVKRETMTDQGLHFVRRTTEKGEFYFVANRGEKEVNGWVPLQARAKSVGLYNPMTAKTGMAQYRVGASGAGEVYLQLAPGESCLLETYDTEVKGVSYAYYQKSEPAHELAATWAVKFLEGGPTLPAEVKSAKLGSWTNLAGEEVKKFSGTASYTTSFAKPKGRADAWLLDLGNVQVSAKILLNGAELATLIGPIYQVTIPSNLLKSSNTLEVRVTNLMANRIADLDRNGVNWKKFYNINMSPRLPEDRDEKGNFTAARWSPKPSGLLGPVKLMPVQLVNSVK